MQLYIEVGGVTYVRVLVMEGSMLLIADCSWFEEAEADIL